VATLGRARKILMLLSTAALGGCTGLVEGWGAPEEVAVDEPDAGVETVATARAAFDRDVLPLVTTMCSGCHANGDMAIAWMKQTPDEYTTMKGWPHLLELGAPATSMLLVKGMHQGPAWSAEQSAQILSWIDMERDEQQPVEMVVEIPAADIVDGMNTFPLDTVGSVGSKVTTSIQKLTAGVYMSQIKITAGPEGIHFKHPLFVTWNGATPTPDPADSFDTVELDLAAGMTATIGGGLLMLPSVPTGAKMSISFKSIGKAIGSGTTTLAGCKNVPSFTTNARTPLSGNCVSCHGGTNGGATAAVDMTKVNDTSTGGQTAACGQILSRVNLTTPDQSGILLAPDPASGVGHPFKFSAANFTTFKTSLTTWITAEKP